MDWQTPLTFLAAVGFSFGVAMYSGLTALRRRVRELEDSGWSSQVMTWADYVALPPPLHGAPCWDNSGKAGPDRKVIVWTRTFIGRPDMKDVL